MKIKIFTFIKPSETATMFSHKMAKYVAAKLDLPIHWDNEVANGDNDLLIIIAGGMPFCAHLDALGKAVLKSKHVVYCMNDYKTSKLPPIATKGQSPFRAAFRLRHKRGMAGPQIWSTVNLNYGYDNKYVNWNILGWRPDFSWSNKTNNKALLYYGSWRKNRVDEFDTFFKKPMTPTWISNGADKFAERYPRCEHTFISPVNMIEEIGKYGLGLYLTDSVDVSSPPASRYYEMLSAGLPMVFHKAAVKTLPNCNAIKEEMIVESADDIPAKMKMQAKIAKLQATWRRDFNKDLDQQFKRAMKDVTE